MQCYYICQKTAPTWRHVLFTNASAVRGAAGLANGCDQSSSVEQQSAPFCVHRSNAGAAAGLSKVAVAYFFDESRGVDVGFMRPVADDQGLHDPFLTYPTPVVPDASLQASLSPSNRWKMQSTFYAEVQETIRCYGGYFFDGETCAKCPVGTFRTISSRDDASCTRCPRNSTNRVAGMLSSIGCICDSGYEGSTDPARLDFITLSGYTEDKACFPCSPGFYGQPWSDQCFSCQPGFFSAGPAQPICQPTDPGYYQDEVEARSQKPVPAGYFSATKIALAPIPCGPGRYTDTNGSVYCSSCARGTFAEGVGNSNCQTCPGERTTAEVGASSIQECVCPEGFYGGLATNSSYECFSCGALSSSRIGAASASECSLQSGVIAGIVVSVVGAALLMAAFAVFWRKHQRLAASFYAHVDRELQSALRGSEEFSHPMVLISFRAFSQMKQLIPHEDVRRTMAQDLIYVDSIHEAGELQAKGYIIVFFSHQWTSFKTPDPTNTQYKLMLASVEAMKLPTEKVYCWVDIISIPQRHPELMQLAINSLPSYSFTCNYFVIVAPPVPHAETCEVCDFGTYQERGWCRAEQISCFCKNGLDKMWLADHEENGGIQKVQDVNIAKMAVHVFNGKFTCCARKHVGMTSCDKEKLVAPILGLFGAAYKQRSKRPEVLELIDDPEIFPEKFVFEYMHGGRLHRHKKKLFGDRIALMKEFIDNETTNKTRRPREKWGKPRLRVVNATRTSSPGGSFHSRPFEFD